MEDVIPFIFPSEMSSVVQELQVQEQQLSGAWCPHGSKAKPSSPCSHGRCRTRRSGLGMLLLEEKNRGKVFLFLMCF